MPRAPTAIPSLTPAQLRFVVDELLRRRRVTVADVRSCLSEMTREIARLEAQLTSLRGARAATRARTAGGGAQSQLGIKVRKRRRMNLSPARRAELKLQGHYLALMRRTPAAKRAQFKQIRVASGLKAANEALKAAQGK